MEGSGDTECSKTSHFGKNEDEEKDIDERKFKDGGSSRNSTVAESEKKPPVRPYVRSKLPRLRWTPDLHLRFIHAVDRLGGQDKATPKLVLQLMNVKGLNIAHVKSHLQMFRSKKVDEPGMADHRLFMESGDGNIYNLISQIPMISSLNERHSSTFRYGTQRYGDASWNGHENWTHSFKIGHYTINRDRPAGFYGTLTERIFGPIFHEYESEPICQYLKNSNELNPSKLIRERVEKQTSSGDIINPLDLDRSMIMSVQNQTFGKRKVSDCKIDSNLTLGIGSRNDESQGGFGDDDECSLSLSLCSPPSSSKFRRLKKDGRGASTLDLTL